MVCNEYSNDERLQYNLYQTDMAEASTSGLPNQEIENEEFTRNELDATENGTAGIQSTFGASPDLPTPTKPKKKRRFPVRYVIVIMGFFACVNMYMMYLNLTVAWPAMVDHNATELGTLDDQKGVFFEKSEIDLIDLESQALSESLSSIEDAHRKEAHQQRSPTKNTDSLPSKSQIKDTILPPGLPQEAHGPHIATNTESNVERNPKIIVEDNVASISSSLLTNIRETTITPELSMTDADEASNEARTLPSVSRPKKGSKSSSVESKTSDTKRRKRSALPNVQIHSRVPKVVIESPSKREPTTEGVTESESTTESIVMETSQSSIHPAPESIFSSQSPESVIMDLTETTTNTFMGSEITEATVSSLSIPDQKGSFSNSGPLLIIGVSSEADSTTFKQLTDEMPTTTDSSTTITNLPMTTIAEDLIDFPTDSPELQIPVTTSKNKHSNPEEINETLSKADQTSDFSKDEIIVTEHARPLLSETIQPIETSVIESELTTLEEEPSISTDLPSISTNLVQTDQSVQKETKTSTLSSSGVTSTTPIPEFAMKVNGSVFEIFHNATEAPKYNESHPFLRPLHELVCGNSSKPCLFEQTYDIIDRHGSAKANKSSNESFVTLRPIPNFTLSEQAKLGLKRRDDDDDNVKDNEDEEEESEEDSDEDSDENGSKGHRVKSITLKLGDHFKLKNCSISITNNTAEFRLDRDIKCLNNLDVLSLSIVFADGSSSSSSSSSSEEDEDSDEDDDDDDEEESNEGEEEDDDDEEEEDEEEEEEEEEDEEEENEQEDFNQKEKHDETSSDKHIHHHNIEKAHGSDGVQARSTILSPREDLPKTDEEDSDHKLEKLTQQEDNEEQDNEKYYQSDYTKVSCEDSSEECGDGEENIGEPEEEGEEGEGEEGEEGEEEEGETEEEKKSEKEATEESPEGKTGEKQGLIILDNERVPSSVCFYKKKVRTSFDGYENGEFSWQPQMLNEVTSAYYWGFLILQIPAGKLTSMLGGKIVLLSSIFLAGATTIVTPFLAEAGLYWLIAGRVFLGMLLGLVMPALQTLLAQWAPPLERTRMVAYTYSGIAIGAAIGGPLSAYLVQQIGWRALFFGQGVMAIMWCLLFFVLVSESPSHHTGIPSTEKQYILNAIGQQHAGKGLPVPWCSIIRSRHVLAMMLAQGAFIWAWHTLLHYAPLYIATVLHQELPDVQKVWAAALCCMFVMTCVYGTIADWARKSRKTATITIRRAANSICSLITAAFLVGVSQSYCNTEAVKVCFALAIAIGVPGAICGIFPNSLDLTPNHAGAVAGIVGAFATTASLLSPYYWILVVYGQSTLERWRTIWYTSAIFLLLANCMYFLLVGAREQRWNRPPNISKVPRRNEPTAVPRRNYNGVYKNQAYVSTERL